MTLIFLLGVFFMGNISCVIDTGNLDYLASITDSDRDSDDRSRIGRRKFSRSSNKCEDSERCENICDQILDYSKERRNCYGLSLKEIGKIEDVFEALKKPTKNSLKNIRGGDFDLFASIALSSWSNLIRGEYRRDEANDDDDKGDGENGDDRKIGRENPYETEEVKYVLDWLIENKFIAESIRDFSGRDNHILADLLVQLNKTFTCDNQSSNIRGNDICLKLKGSSLTTGQQNILQGIKILYSDKAVDEIYLRSVVNLSSSVDEVSAMYELTHDLLSRVCEDVDSLEIDSKNYGRDHAYKICLSWAYFCPVMYKDKDDNIKSVPDEDEDDELVYNIGENQIDQYLLKDTYRRTAEESLTECTFLTNEPKWSDYWN